MSGLVHPSSQINAKIPERRDDDAGHLAERVHLGIAECLDARVNLSGKSTQYRDDNHGLLCLDTEVDGLIVSL